MRATKAIWILATAALLFGVGCDPDWHPPGGDGGLPPEEAFQVWNCHCVVTNEYGNVTQQFDVQACASFETVPVACLGACRQQDAVAELAPLPNSFQGTGEACPPAPPPPPPGAPPPPPPAPGAYSLSGGGRNSSEARADPRSSRATFTFADLQQTVGVTGGVLFTGGCEGRSTCRISFRQMSLRTDDFAVGSGGAVAVRNVHLLTMNEMVAVQSDGSFEIPADQIQVLLNASVNGVQTSRVFVPGARQGVSGFYSPSTGSFSLRGLFYSSTSSERLEFNLQGVATSRPPVADAGSAQRVTAGRDGLALATLDGRRSYDLDGDLANVFWYEGSTYLGRGTTLERRFATGTHRVTAQAVDATNKWSYATTVVEVLAP